ncbi:MAG: flagellin lysine-N-methylase, partial [Gallintestinimicrobium sp.]
IALSNLLAHLQTEEELPAQWQAFRTAFAQYEPLMRSYLANEVYSELLSFEDATRHMLVRLQWLMLQYAALRQSLFLIWQDSPETFSYEKVREALVIINRMTGYDEEDIYEYLENSFESLLWDWGYFALLAGF